MNLCGILELGEVVSVVDVRQIFRIEFLGHVIVWKPLLRKF